MIKKIFLLLSAFLACLAVYISRHYVLLRCGFGFMILRILLVTDGCDPTVMIICYVLVSYSPSQTKEDLSFTKLSYKHN